MKKIIYLIVAVVFFTCSAPVLAATTIQVSPQSGAYANAFSVSVSINSDDAFNAAQVSVSLDNVSVSDLVLGNCGFSFLTIPTASNPTFVGVILGGSSKQCTVYTMTLKPVLSGSGSIVLSDASVKAAGSAKELLTSVSNGSYSLTASGESGRMPTPTGVSGVGGDSGYTLSVKVLSGNNTPVSNSQVLLQPQGAGQSIQMATGQDGVATLDKVPPGVYTLTTFDKSGKKTSEKIVNVSGNQPILVFGIQEDAKSQGGFSMQALGIGAIVIAGLLAAGFFFYRRWKGSR